MIDANALDRTGGPRDVLVERFAAEARDGRFTVLLATGVRDELDRPETPRAVRDVALAYPAAPRRTPTHEQKLDRIRVRAILRGDAGSAKHEADAAHLSDAAEAGCAWFLTHDKRILRRRDELRRVMPGLRIATLERFLAGADEDDREAD